MRPGGHHPVAVAPPRCTSPTAPQVDPGLFELGVPVLGICYGHQLMAQALGGEVAATGQREYGGTTLARRPSRVAAARRTSRPPTPCGCRHGDAVTRAPEGFRVTAHAPTQIPIAAMEDPERGSVRGPVPPRGLAHPARAGRDEAVPLRRLRSAARLDAHQHHRRRGRRGSARRSATREVLCALVGRSGFRGGRAAGAPGGGRPAHVRVRRSRAEPRGRARPGGGDVRAPLPGARSCT